MAEHESHALIYRTLSIAEIQDRVFSFNDAVDAARCARVCRDWSEVALNHAWHTVDRLDYLFKLLCSMERSGKGLVFTRLLEPADWERFSRTAKRIRKLDLQFDHPNQNAYKVHENAFLEVCRSSPSCYILPNLVALAFDIYEYSDPDWLRFAIVFLNPSLRILRFQLPVGRASENRVALMTFLSEISSRSPLLKVLTAYYSCPVVEMEHSMVDFFTRMQRLEEITVSDCTLTPSILASIAKLPELILLRVDPLKRGGSPTDIHDLFTKSNGMTFPSIRHLDIQGQVESISAGFLGHRNDFRFLRAFGLDMTGSNNVAHISSFIASLCNTCTALQQVSFTRTDRKTSAFIGPFVSSTMNYVVDDNERISWSIYDLAPFTTLKHLHTLTIEHARPLLATNDELIEFITACKQLTSLRLNPKPKAPDINDFAGVIPTILVVPRVLHRCRQLKDLSLFLDATDCNYNCSRTPKSSLKSLNVGASFIGDPEDLAFFLAQFLPTDCRLLDGNSPASSKLRTVQKILPRLLNLRERDRARISELENELRLVRQDMSQAVSMDQKFRGDEGDEANIFSSAV